MKFCIISNLASYRTYYFNGHIPLGEPSINTYASNLGTPLPRVHVGARAEHGPRQVLSALAKNSLETKYGMKY